MFPHDTDVLQVFLHPELVEEYPPILIESPGDTELDGEEPTDYFLGKLPENLERACWTWTADGGPYHDPGTAGNDYTALASVPGWKLGGWVPYVSFYPEPAERCSCGAPATLLLAISDYEDLAGPWLPRGDPGFSWAGRPGSAGTGIWGGRNGLMWLVACTTDPGHPILTYDE